MKSVTESVEYSASRRRHEGGECETDKGRSLKYFTPSRLHFVRNMLSFSKVVEFPLGEYVKMSRAKEVYEFLKLVGANYDKPVTAGEIAEALGYADDRGVRKVMMRAMKSTNKAIGADTRGFYLIRNAHEMQRYLNSLLKRQVKITERIDTVYKAYHKQYVIGRV